MTKGRVLVTTGDLNGVGLEITAKAISKIKISRGLQLIVFTSESDVGKNSPRYKNILLQSFKKSAVVGTIDDALHPDLMDRDFILVQSDLSPGQWVIQASLACASGLASGLVTAPLSKVGLKKDGLPFLGHTDIFRKVLKIKSLRMLFLGRSFNVVLHSDHIPLKKVPASLKVSELFKTLEMVSDYFKKDRRPICVLGLNPHSGESGLLGKEELKVLKSLPQKMKSHGFRHRVDLFKSPDTAFLKSNWKAYSTYVACYHDQGLIPFKLVHGIESGVHVTLGLPFFRTSVDHGTAFDLFDQDKASYQSMQEALELGILLARQN